MSTPIEKAAMWLSEQKETPLQVIHLLRVFEQMAKGNGL